MPSAKLTKASVSNALPAAADAGLPITAMVVQPDGSLRLEFAAHGQTENANINRKIGEKAPKKWGGTR